MAQRCAVSTRHFTILQDPNFFRLLPCIDQELAGELKAGGCACGGVIHRADYPRKPRGCLAQVRSQSESRSSFCCNRCRKRSTSTSVRFLGRRVYDVVAVVIASVRRAGASAAASQLAQTLAVPVRTLERWRGWWRAQFPLTALWRGAGGRFMPPVATGDLSASALERFAGTPAQSMRHFLLFLKPLTVGYAVALTIATWHTPRPLRSSNRLRIVAIRVTCIVQMDYCSRTIPRVMRPAPS